MQRQSFKGMVTEDPLTQRSKGTALRVKAQAFHVETDGESQGVTPLEAFNGTALTVSFRDAEGHHTMGSATLVAPGIAISAKHVVEEWIEGIGSGRVAAVCQGVASHGLELWAVEKVSSMHRSDIALLSLRRRSDIVNSEVQTQIVSTRMPVNGDRVVLTGFTASHRTSAYAPVMEISGHMRACTGEVIETWHEGRDRVMLPGPSFAVNCPAFGGMSGGAVFDDKGHLIGVVSSSTEGDPIAFVSHVWPALVAGVEPVWPLASRQTSLLMMGKRHGVTIFRPDAFKLEIVNGKAEMTYRLWS